MQYVRSLGGSVSKTWNSINPATLSGAIDVVVVEQEDGSLACSPFHVRFGKFSLLRPSDKKVEFRVNGQKQDYSMKLGDGGEAFFVFETTADIPIDLQTSPVISPAGSPQSLSQDDLGNGTSLQEPDLLDLSAGQPLSRSNTRRPRPHSAIFESQGIFIPSGASQAQDDLSTIIPISNSLPTDDSTLLNNIPGSSTKPDFDRSTTADMLEQVEHLSRPHLYNAIGSISAETVPTSVSIALQRPVPARFRSQSPAHVTKQEAINRAMTLSKKLSTSNIQSKVNETGDLMLDMEGYKSTEADALRAEMVARRVLAEELDGSYDIEALISSDEQGNLWIYNSEEAKEAKQAAANRERLPVVSNALHDDAVSDPGHQSDGDKSISGDHSASDSQSQPLNQSNIRLVIMPKTRDGDHTMDIRNYAKTLRLTSDQLKALQLKPGRNPISFTVNRATCQASMHYWTHDVPVVISDIDGTITKSDALGHVLNMLGRDWTHPGVAKLFGELTANGYNIMYLTSRSVGQADTTRAYLEGIVQDGIKLPLGPVILSPDRTIAALRREVYLRKPEVFKMSCLRDIAGLFGVRKNPFYAGFGNRITDALSYRSVNIPSNRIFTINSEGSVSIDILSLNTYKSSYVSMRELVPHFFPPVSLLIKSGGELFTDFQYWRAAPLDVEDFTDSEDGNEADRPLCNDRNDSEDERLDGYEDDDDDEEVMDEMTASYMSRESTNEDAGDLADSILESIENTDISGRNSLEHILGIDAPVVGSKSKADTPSRRGRIRERTADF